MRARDGPIAIWQFSKEMPTGRTQWVRFDFGGLFLVVIKVVPLVVTQSLGSFLRMTSRIFCVNFFSKISHQIPEFYFKFWATWHMLMASCAENSWAKNQGARFIHPASIHETGHF